MRIFLVATGSLVLLVLLGLYLNFSARTRPKIEFEFAKTYTGNVVIEIFSTAELSTSTLSGLEPSSLEVVSRGKELFRTQETVKPWQLIKIPAPDSLVIGVNEVYVAGTMRDKPAPGADFETALTEMNQSDSGVNNKEENVGIAGIRVRVRRDTTVLCDQTLWAPSGKSVAGTVRFEL